MLIEFSVANFRSIRERQTLSMVANNSDKSLPDNVIDVDLPGLKNTKFLKSAAIYGANASGKTNLFSAALFMRDFIRGSTSNRPPGKHIGVQPFRLDDESEGKPSEFEALFVIEGIRYQYGFAVDKGRVYEEWLIAYPLGFPQRWFTRSYDLETEQYVWEFSQKYLKGSKASLSEKTRGDALFLSVGAQFDHKQLTSVYEWFKTHFLFLNGSDLSEAISFTRRRVADNDRMREHILTMMRRADLGISDLVSEQVSPEEYRPLTTIPAEFRQEIVEQLKGKMILEVYMMHRAKDGGEEKVFTEAEESAGTLKLLALSGPWLSVLQTGQPLFVDEIAANMHPLLVRDLIMMMHNPELNKSGAQLIFTTHDTTLLDMELIRRDQIWLTEKDEEGATHLYPLTDFKPRKDEALQKGYLAGRYGGIPFLRGEFTFE